MFVLYSIAMLLGNNYKYRNLHNCKTIPLVELQNDLRYFIEL